MYTAIKVIVLVQQAQRLHIVHRATALSVYKIITQSGVEQRFVTHGPFGNLRTLRWLPTSYTK